MTKEELGKRLANVTELSQKEAVAVIEKIMTIATDELAQGGKITLRGFGTLHVVQRKGKVGRDITHNEAVIVPPCNVVRFKPAKTLKQIVK